MFLSVKVCRWMENAAKTTGIVFVVCPLGFGWGHINPLIEWMAPPSNGGVHPSHQSTVVKNK